MPVLPRGEEVTHEEVLEQQSDPELGSRMDPELRAAIRWALEVLRIARAAMDEQGKIVADARAGRDEARAKLARVIQYGDHLAREAGACAFPGIGTGHLVDAIEAWRSVSAAKGKP